MTEQTSWALLGALIAVAVILLALVIFGLTIAAKAVSYAAKFKGFQAGRNAKSELSFSGIIDETPPPSPRRFEPADVEPVLPPEALN